jgi:hypothetical protein
MIRGFLLDEHLPKWWPATIRRLAPGPIVKRSALDDAPPEGTPDPVLLRYCEEHSFVLFTDNRTTMPGHLDEFKAAGGRMPGIIHVPADYDIKELAIRVALLYGASFDGELDNQIFYIWDF